jgi:cation/acetate symporter
MVGAGVLVQPLLGLQHHWGVLMVGAIVITIVATAGMASTTYVQFLKGGLLILFSLALVIAVCVRGFNTKPEYAGSTFREPATLSATRTEQGLTVAEPDARVIETQQISGGATLARVARGGVENWWLVEQGELAGNATLREAQSVVVTREGAPWINGLPASKENTLRQVGHITSLRGEPEAPRGAVSPFGFLAALSDGRTKVERCVETRLTDRDGSKVTVYYPVQTTGNRLLRPGMKFKVQGTFLERLDFVSLMLALFLGTAALPHILIRYYTVPSPSSARKSTIVAIAAIGFFYILTLFMGLGAMINGVINPADSNMAAPLLARSFGKMLFAFISAIAFATVLGTVSGLIVAASGAVAHDLCDRYLKLHMDDFQKIRAGKISAFVVGAVAIVLGILFKGVNVTFLVGLAFAVAASANLPAILMLLFWKRTTAQGITASIFIGVASSVALILFSPELYKLYGLDPLRAPIPFSNPGIVSIPLSFITLVVVSLLTPRAAMAATTESA